MQLGAGTTSPEAQTAASTASLIPRTCGACNVCCTAMTVRALKKPAGVKCVHQTDTGCGHYDQRPEACRAWFCMWVRDEGRVFTDAQRPDRLGLFFTAAPSDPTAGRQVIHAHEVRRDGANTPAGQAAIDFLAQFVWVQIVPYHEPRDGFTPLTVGGIQTGGSETGGTARIDASSISKNSAG